MKSNLIDLFNERCTKYIERGAFNINDVLDEIMPEFQFYDEQPTYEDLKRNYARNYLTVLFNYRDCYSYKKDNFVNLELATKSDLQSLDENIQKDIMGREKTLRRIRELEGSHQLVMVTDDPEHFGETVEEQTLFDLLMAVE